MNIQSLENFKNLSSEQKRDVLGNLLVMENSQYNENGYDNIDYMTEFSEDIAINYQGTKRRIVNTALDKRELRNEVSINDILYEYNPDMNMNVQLSNNRANMKNNNNNNNFSMNSNMDAYSLNVAMDDFVT